MESLKYPTVKKALLYEKLPTGKVRCGVCERRCVIAHDKKGFCKTRVNIEGRLYTTAYGDISAVESRPIEIKPFFHFYPGSTALTFSTWSCNFRCPWCQNHHLSKVEPVIENANYVAPEKMVERALLHGDEGLCVSFNEPTMLFEYSLDAFKIAREKGLYNCFVSNGYLSVKVLRMLRDAGMDAINIDVKGNEEVYRKYCGGVSVEAVWRNAKKAKRLGMHVEIINLVIPGLNDDVKSLDQVIERHIEIGDEIPLHLTRYHPAYRFNAPATGIKTLEYAYELAKKKGVLYPYIGNVSGHKYENTYCPTCGELLIKRYVFRVVDYRITPEKRCPKCDMGIPITGDRVKKI